MIRFDSPGEWRARFEVRDFDRLMEMAIIRRDDAGTLALDALSFVKVSEAAPVPRAAEMLASEGKRFLQAIVDAAWEAGVKPRQHADAMREGASQLRHLEDMRRLVFKE